MNQQTNQTTQQQHRDRDREAEMKVAFHEYAMAATRTRPIEVVTKTPRKVRIPQGRRITELMFAGEFPTLDKHDLTSVLTFLGYAWPSTKLYDMELNWVNDEALKKSYCDANEVMPLIEDRYKQVLEKMNARSEQKAAARPTPSENRQSPVKPVSKTERKSSRVLSLLKALPQTTLMEVLARDRGMSVGDLYAEIIGDYIEKIAGEA
jgi:hypothetical protein